MQVISRRQSDVRSGDERRGAALVEFAIVAPLFLTLILGTVEIGNALEASSQINAALREAGRLAGMDWVDLVDEGETPNQKVIRDIRNFLKAAGYPGDALSITITSAEDSDFGEAFDLGDPDNEMRLFQIEATIAFEEISTFPLGFMNGHNVSGRIVMRAGRISLMD